VWDGDWKALAQFADYLSRLFRAHRVGWRPIFSRAKAPAGQSSEPTVWDGDIFIPLNIPGVVLFRAHRVGWRHITISSFTGEYMRSEPTVWDGDAPTMPRLFLAWFCSEPTVWDGDDGY